MTDLPIWSYQLEVRSENNGTVAGPMHVASWEIEHDEPMTMLGLNGDGPIRFSRADSGGKLSMKCYIEDASAIRFATGWMESMALGQGTWERPTLVLASWQNGSPAHERRFSHAFCQSISTWIEREDVTNTDKHVVEWTWRYNNASEARHDRQPTPCQKILRRAAVKLDWKRYGF